jgi:hypothetical protein
MLFEEWLTTNSQPLLLEGGAAGHMAHPYDEKGFTFGDFKDMINAGLSGNLSMEEEPTEKVDGQNVFATIQDGEVKFARNKGELKNPMSLSEFKTKFEGHPSKLVQDTFQFAADDLASLLLKLPKAEQESYFDNGLNFMNMELIYSQNPNVIVYDAGNIIMFHGIKKTDGQGNIIGEDNKAAKDIANLLKPVNADVGKTFNITPPQFIKLGKDINFAENHDKFIKKIDALRDKYGLSDSDTISKYNEMWWKEQIEHTFPNLPDNIKEGLLLRWAYDDKKTLNMRSLAKEVSPEEAAAISKFDKEDSKKKYKENVEPFEDIFLEMGSIVLKNASQFLALSPDKEKQRLQAEISKAAEEIKHLGTAQQIEKVGQELTRLQRIGGIESIVPTEGIVFRYKGNTYKLTGTFAAINQLLGIMKYGR